MNPQEIRLEVFRLLLANAFPMEKILEQATLVSEWILKNGQSQKSPSSTGNTE